MEISAGPEFPSPRLPIRRCRREGEMDHSGTTSEATREAGFAAARAFLHEEFEANYPADSCAAGPGVPEPPEGFAKRRADAIHALNVALKRTWAPGLSIADWAELAGADIGLQPEI